MCPLWHIHFPVGCFVMSDLTTDDLVLIAAHLETIYNPDKPFLNSQIVTLIRKVRWAIAVQEGLK